MSKRKNNITYVKPQDPSFLRAIKEQIGYKDLSDTVETKRQRCDSGSDDENNLTEKADELPQVVVLKSGDLTAKEAEEEQKRLEREENLKPADLSERVIFKARSKSKPEISESTLKNLDKTSDCEKKEKSVKNRKIKESKSKLSFNDEEEEDF